MMTDWWARTGNTRKASYLFCRPNLSLRGEELRKSSKTYVYSTGLMLLCPEAHRLQSRTAVFKSQPCSSLPECLWASDIISVFQCSYLYSGVDWTKPTSLSVCELVYIKCWNLTWYRLRTQYMLIIITEEIRTMSIMPPTERGQFHLFNQYLLTMYIAMNPSPPKILVLKVLICRGGTERGVREKGKTKINK